MTSVTIAHKSVAGRTGFRAAWIGRTVALPLIWMRRVRQRRELMGLMAQPDYLIKDIGLQRDKITSESLKPFWMA